jgi:hypothetical protein
MLRIGFLASTIPLLLAGLFAGGGVSGGGARPCLVLGDGPLQIATAPWRAGFQRPRPR